jgi:SAM-dependent methyltransferase
MHDVIVQSNPIPLQPFQTVAEYARLGIRPRNFLVADSLDGEQVEGQFALRRQFRRDYGYVVASAEVMTVLAELLKNLGIVLDAGSGSGYLAKKLTELGIPTFAVDYCDFRATRPDGHGYPINAVFQLDALGDAASFISAKFGVVLMTWPPYDNPFALQVAQAVLPGQLLVYEGEDAGGCTADAAFFEYLRDSSLWEPLLGESARLNAVHVTLDTLHDHWMVWKRKN